MFDRVISMENLRLAFKRVKANNGGPGGDGQTVEQFEARLDKNLQRLHWELRTGSYQPQPGRLVLIPKAVKGELRPLYIPTTTDRVVQTALLIVLGPRFDRDFAEHSHGFRKGRGCHDALRQVITLLEDGHVHVVDADIRKFFDSINHATLLDLIQQKIKEEQTLRLIQAFLKAGALKGGLLVETEFGTPQGGPISPLLANIYLSPLDHLVADAGFEMVRYADDFIILCQRRAEAEQALKLVKDWMEGALLTLHPDKTDIVDARQPDGFTFLGYHFQGHLRSPRPENVIKLRVKIEEAVQQHRSADLNEAIPVINQITRGWLQHFQLCNNPQPFQDIDYWVWECLTTAQWKTLRKNRPQQPKPLQQAPFSLTRSLQRLRQQ